MKIENLRSPHEKTGDLCCFGRLVDKIRLHLGGHLPEDYVPNLGIGLDGRCVNFLGVAYPALAERVQQGGSDEEILDWCFSQGRNPSEEELEVWNEFMRKRGWNDAGSPMLARRKNESGFGSRTDIQTFFDYIDADEGRAPRL